VIAAGERSATFDVALTGDTTPEPDESFVVRITNVTGADVGDAEATGIIRNDDIVVVPIHAIQGSGSISPLDGQVVVTEGVITARRSNGFFVQTADGEDDGNPETSEGLFVFTSSTAFPAVAVGNRVRVSGRVVDFTPSSNLNQRPLTEITGGGGVTVQVSLRAAGAALPKDMAILNTSTVLLGPWPDQNYALEIVGTIRPPSQGIMTSHASLIPPFSCWTNSRNRTNS
jgi:predicted extracellular nuclease